MRETEGLSAEAIGVTLVGGLHQDDSPLAVLHIEHIIPKIHGGSDDLENLALACVDCNLHKGTNLTGIDPQTDAVTRLFHPRRDK